MPQMKRMLYRDSAEAGEKRTNEERGKAESKAIISSLNSIELSENVSDDGNGTFRGTRVPEMPFGDRTGRALLPCLRRKAAEGETKTRNRKGEETI